jgi:hypothetical protein
MKSSEDTLRPTPQIDPRLIVKTAYSSEEGYDGEAVGEMPDFVEIIIRDGRLAYVTY